MPAEKDKQSTSNANLSNTKLRTTKQNSEKGWLAASQRQAQEGQRNDEHPAGLKSLRTSKIFRSTPSVVTVVLCHGRLNPELLRPHAERVVCLSAAWEELLLSLAFPSVRYAWEQLLLNLALREVACLNPWEPMGDGRVRWSYNRSVV